MLHTFKSHSLTILAERLAEEQNQRIPRDPFEPVQIVVPNLDTSRWLRLILSKQNGILANYRFLLPAEWQFQQIRKTYRGLPTQLPSDPGPLTWSLFDLLMDDRKRTLFTRPDRYVRMQPNEVKEQVVYQLSARIASVYDQYIVYRPELITGWQKGEISKDEDEQWQAKLWLELEKERKKREKGTGFPNKAELILEASELLKSGKTEYNQPLYLFNPGLMPVPIVKMAEHVSEQTDVLLFLMMFRNNINREPASEHPLLQAFGEEANGVQSLYTFRNTKSEQLQGLTESKPESLLRHIQCSIIEDTIPSRWEGDLNSVEIRSCHSPLREIEVLYHFLLRCFQDHPDLTPDDVIVATPDLDTYLPFIHAVFGTEQEGLPEIPYHAGFKSHTGNGLNRVLRQLMDLIDSRMKFSEVTDLFMETAIRQRFDVSESGTMRIKRWMEENHVIWGMNQEHRKEVKQPESDLHTWESALRRGWKGILTGEQADPFADGDLHFHRIKGREREEEWSAFSTFLGKLREFGNVSKEKRTVGQWCDFTQKLIQSFCSEEVLKERDADEIRRTVDSMRESGQTSGVQQKLSFRLFRTQFKKQMDNRSASTASFSRGVTFSTMVPVRSIPAKIIALIGLNESDFPRKPKAADFDLMARDPEPTDRNRKNEDRNLFLESIMSAGQIHYCSYIGMSRVDNEPIPPSPIVSEWLNFIASIAGIKSENLVVSCPLHGFSYENFTKKESFSSVEFLTSKRMRKSEEQVQGLTSEEPIFSKQENEHLMFDEIDIFYANPVRAFFKSHFNPEINRAEERKKEFELNGLERHLLFERVFGWRLDEKGESQILDLLYRSGTVPEGWPGKNLLKEILLLVDSAINLVLENGFNPEINEIELDIRTDHEILSGTITSYSSERILDITSSGFNGTRLFRSWIRHLCGNVSGHFSGLESHFLSDLKKSKPKWITFQPVDDAMEQLEQVIRIFRTGTEQPIMLFPSTSFEYEKAIFKNMDNPNDKAANTFEGSDFNRFAENQDLFISFLAGDEPDFDPDFIYPEFRSLLTSMLNHMESA